MFSSRSADRARGPLERLGKVVVVEDIIALKMKLVEATLETEILEALQQLSKQYISLELLESTQLGRIVKGIVKRNRSKPKSVIKKLGSDLEKTKEKTILEEIEKLSVKLLKKWKDLVRPALERRNRINQKFKVDDNAHLNRKRSANKRCKNDFEQEKNKSLPKPKSVIKRIVKRRPNSLYPSITRPVTKPKRCNKRRCPENTQNFTPNSRYKPLIVKKMPKKIKKNVKKMPKKKIPKK